MEKWKIENSRIVHDASPFLRLRQDKVVLPSGLVIEDYNVVEEPNAVTIFALTAEKELLLVEQYKHGIGEICLEVPGGVMDKSEPLAEAQRELLEETGYHSSRWQEA